MPRGIGQPGERKRHCELGLGPLESLDLEGEIEVVVGGAKLPSRDAGGNVAWRYLTATNEVEFFWPHVPGQGKTVAVRCTPSCGL